MFIIIPALRDSQLTHAPHYYYYYHYHYDDDYDDDHDYYDYYYDYYCRCTQILNAGRCWDEPRAVL
jgi:hypothetical protein